LALTSDLFDVLFTLPCGTKSDFLEEAMTFQEKLLLAPVSKTAKLVKSSDKYSEKQFKRMRPQLLRGTSVVSQPRQFKGLHKGGDFSRSRWSQLRKPLKVMKTKRFLKRFLCMCSNI
jgi:hypothetical protein